MLEEFTEICSSGRNLLLKTFKVQTIQQTEDQCQLLEKKMVCEPFEITRTSVLISHKIQFDKNTVWLN